MTGCSQTVASSFLRRSPLLAISLVDHGGSARRTRVHRGASEVYWTMSELVELVNNPGKENNL